MAGGGVEALQAHFVFIKWLIQNQPAETHVEWMHGINACGSSGAHLTRTREVLGQTAPGRETDPDAADTAVSRGSNGQT